MAKLENDIPQAPETVRDTYGTHDPSEMNLEPAIQ